MAWRGGVSQRCTTIVWMGRWAVRGSSSKNARITVHAPTWPSSLTNDGLRAISFGGSRFCGERSVPIILAMLAAATNW